MWSPGCARRSISGPRWAPRSEPPARSVAAWGPLRPVAEPNARRPQPELTHRPLIAVALRTHVLPPAKSSAGLALVANPVLERRRPARRLRNARRFSRAPARARRRPGAASAPPAAAVPPGPASSPLGSAEVTPLRHAPEGAFAAAPRSAQQHRLTRARPGSAALVRRSEGRGRPALGDTRAVFQAQRLRAASEETARDDKPAASYSPRPLRAKYHRR